MVVHAEIDQATIDRAAAAGLSPRALVVRCVARAVRDGARRLALVFVSHRAYTPHGVGRSSAAAASSFSHGAYTLKEAAHA